jgi:hypothetical protein
MKKLFFILSVVLLASCSNTETTKSESPKDNISLEENPVEIEMSDEQIAMDMDSFDDSPSPKLAVDADAFKSPKNSGPYANPFFIYGTDFGNFFQTMYIHGKFDQMIAFTSAQSKSQFGEDVILDFYKNELEFGYDIGKYPLSNGTSGDIITINYEADIMATKKIVRINVIVENDSCKIVLPNNLKDFPG